MFARHGADISIFKANKIGNNVSINSKYTRKIRVIGQSIIYSLGTAKSDIIFDNVIISNYFQIVDESFPSHVTEYWD